MKNEEEWRDIKGYEGLYKVSNLGRIKGLERISPIGHHLREKILKPAQNNDGYLLVGLHKNGKQKIVSLHRLVAQTFIDNPNNLPQINHRDENKTNNCIDNLEWCTNLYNHQYGTINQRVAKNHSKPVIAINLSTGEKIKFDSVREAEKELSLWNQNISAVLCGRYKSTGGYTFKFDS